MFHITQKSINKKLKSKQKTTKQEKNNKKTNLILLSKILKYTQK